MGAGPVVEHAQLRAEDRIAGAEVFAVFADDFRWYSRHNNIIRHELCQVKYFDTICVKIYL